MSSKGSFVRGTHRGWTHGDCRGGGGRSLELAVVIRLDRPGLTEAARRRPFRADVALRMVVKRSATYVSYKVQLKALRISHGRDCHFAEATEVRGGYSRMTV